MTRLHSQSTTGLLVSVLCCPHIICNYGVVFGALADKISVVSENI